MTIPFEVDTNFLNTHTESMLGDFSMNGAFARSDPSPALRDQTYVTVEDNTAVLPNSMPLSGLSSGFLSNTTLSGILNPRTFMGTANQIDVADGDGVSGNPTLSLSGTLVLPGTLTCSGDATFNGAHSYFPHEIVLSSVASVIRATNGNQVHIVSDDIDTPIDLVSNYVAVQSAICHRVSNGIYQTGNNITFGNQTQTHNISGSSIFDISASGFRIGSGSRVTEISNNPNAMLSTQLMDAESIQIAIANYSTSVKSFRGGYNASTDLYPSTGGTGVGGLPKAGDVWVITTGGTLGGTTVSHGDTLIALIDTPGQTASNWSINVNGVALWNGRGGVVFPEDDDYSYDQIEGLPDTAPLGKIMRGNGTEWTETTAQYPDTAGTSGNVLTSDGTNFVSTTLSGGSFGTLWQNSGNYTGMSFSFTTSYQALTGATSWTLATPNVDFTAAVDGQLKYTGAATKTFLVSAYFTVLTSGAGFSIALYVNGSLVSGSESQSPTGYACVIQNFPITLNQNDYISLYGKRAAAASNAIIQMSLSARSV